MSDRTQKRYSLKAAVFLEFNDDEAKANTDQLLKRLKQILSETLVSLGTAQIRIEKPSLRLTKTRPQDVSGEKSEHYVSEILPNEKGKYHSPAETEEKE